MRALRTQIDAAQGPAGDGDGDSDGVAALLEDARRSLDGQDYWRAVDLYEQALTRHADNAEARAGAARARLLARFSAQLGSAGSDPARLQAVGDLFAGEAPDLAGRAYSAAFAGRPTIVALRGLLLALVQSGQRAAVAGEARAGVRALRASGRVADEGATDAALDALSRQADGTTGIAGAAEAVEQLVHALVASARHE